MLYHAWSVLLRAEHLRAQLSLLCITHGGVLFVSLLQHMVVVLELLRVQLIAGLGGFHLLLENLQGDEPVKSTVTDAPCTGSSVRLSNAVVMWCT